MQIDSCAGALILYLLSLFLLCFFPVSSSFISPLSSISTSHFTPHPSILTIPQQLSTALTSPHLTFIPPPHPHPTTHRTHRTPPQPTSSSAPTITNPTSNGGITHSRHVPVFHSREETIALKKTQGQDKRQRQRQQPPSPPHSHHADR